MEGVKKGKDGSVRCNSKRKTGDMAPLDKFMAEYLEDQGKSKGKAKPSMNSLRHYIPLLVNLLFPAEEQGNKVKVKGMWDKKPEGWPVDVAFKDPNNAKPDLITGKKGRPTHKTLMDMFEVLVEKYDVLGGQKCFNPLDGKVSFSFIESISPISQEPFSSPQDDVLEEKCRPPILDRIESKIQVIELKQLEEETNISLLHQVKKCLMNMYNNNGPQPSLFEAAHECECPLDCIIECGVKLNKDSKWKLHQFAEKQKTKDIFQLGPEKVKADQRDGTDMFGDPSADLHPGLKALQSCGILHLRDPVPDLFKSDMLLKTGESTLPKVVDDINEKEQEYNKSKPQSHEESEMYINDVMTSSTGSTKCYQMGSDMDGKTYNQQSGENDVGVLSKAVLISGINQGDPGDAVDPTGVPEGSVATELIQDSGYHIEMDDSQDLMLSGNFEFSEFEEIIHGFATGDVYLEDDMGTSSVAHFVSVSETPNVDGEEVVCECLADEDEHRGDLDSSSGLSNPIYHDLDPMLASAPNFVRSSQQLPEEHPSHFGVIVKPEAGSSNQPLPVMCTGESDPRCLEVRNAAVGDESKFSTKEEDMETDDM